MGRKTQPTIHNHKATMELTVLLFTLISCSSANTWNTPIRIGVRANQRSQRQWLNLSRPLSSSLLASTAATSTPSTIRGGSSSVGNSVSPGSNEYDFEDASSSIYDEAEWRALFEQDDNRRVSYAARRTIHPTLENHYEAHNGFRYAMKLPSFLPHPQDEEIAFNDYEEAAVVPCAAVAVSSKLSGKRASFSPSLQSDRPHRGSTLNFRKETTNQAPRSSLNAQASGAASASAKAGRPLVFWENMVCGAISRSVAQTVMHPANTMKTILQQPKSPSLVSFLRPQQFPVLFRGAGANFILSVPHGAINFAVLEMVRKELSRGVKASRWASKEDKLGPALDFMSSAISTICCSIVSTPQMMITDNIMAGNFKNLPEAVKGLASQGKGLQGFYAKGWWPGLVGKIPSYALTWTFFQQLKVAQQKLSGREATNMENSIMGCIASGTTVCIMIPMDTIKTRLVTQASNAAGSVPYKGIIDCAVRVAREEGASAFYRGLPPRLISVVPMIGIQFTVYEFMKRVMQKRAAAGEAKLPSQQQQQQQPLTPRLPFRMKKRQTQEQFDPYSSLQVLQEASMEVAASPEHPYPAPHFLRIMRKKSKKGGEAKKDSKSQ